ncbi:MAG: FtsX-like permease family protein, partial [Acidimicrobiia bacterium]
YLFFAVGLEQRTTEVGLLSTIGFSTSQIRRAFIREGLILTGAGVVIGSVAAVAYGALILYGLRTWWIGAVGTRDLLLHVDPAALAAGVAGAFTVALLALWGGIRALSRRSPRALLKGATTVTTPRAKTITRIVAGAFALLGLAMLAMAITGSLDQTAGFFGAGGSWLVAGLCAASILLRRRSASGSLGRGSQGLFALGIRQSSARPARSVLSLALIAFASFVLVTVGAFKKDASAAPTDARSGTGGFALMGESVAPLMHDPNDTAGRDGLGRAVEEVFGVAVSRVRLRPGGVASCLTLCRRTNPRIVAPEPRFLESPRFTFAASMAASPDEIANPWRLLNRTFDDGAIPAIADQTTLMYSLHLGIGDDFTFTPQGHEPIRLRIVGALADSVLQSEMIISEGAFMRLFPRQEGYRVWMIESPHAQRAALTTYLEDRLSDFGMDIVDTRERWDSYHQVENTYLATFQALGSLGLLLGTIGLGAVLAHNVLERRKEIALVRAIGFTPADVRTMVLAEGLTLVIGGLAIGAGCAFIAITPVLMERAQALPWASVIGLIVGVVVTGSLASLAAIHMTARVPITAAIKGE